jgi:hypothetical protein
MKYTALTRTVDRLIIVIVQQAPVDRVDTSITLTETIYSTKEFEKFRQLDTEHVDYDQANNMWNTEKKKLQGMRDLMGDGYTQTVTYQMKDYGVGRLYPYPYNSYQNTYNILRRIFLDGNLIPVDIVNAHPTFMTQLCDRFSDFTPEILNTYVVDKDVVRKLIMKECGRLESSGETFSVGYDVWRVL